MKRAALVASDAPCGQTIAVTKIVEHDASIAAGATWHGCVARRALAIHDLTLDEHVDFEGSAFASSNELQAIELDGRWYLLP